MRGINRCEGRHILAVVARVVISHVPSIHGIGGLLVVVVKLLNVEGVASCVVTQLSSRTWFKRSILGSGPSLGVEVFSQVIYGRLELVYCAWTAWGSFVVHNGGLGVVEHFNIVCCVESLLSCMRVFEDLCQNSFCWLVVVVKRHSSTMNCVKLAFYVNSTR